MNKILLVGIIISIFLVGTFLITYNFPQKIDCDSYGAIYLKPSELDQASKIADKENVVVVIPELNQLIARTEILGCPSFDYTRYVE